MYLKVSGMIKSLIITGLIFVSSVVCCVVLRPSKVV